MSPRFATVTLGLLLAAVVALAGNPIAPHLYTADPAARVFDGRLYVYTSHDEKDATYFDMWDWRLFSTADLKSWQDHGSVFSVKGFAWAKQYAWAPDVITANGKYYLFLPVDRTKIGVAVADAPTGPFTDAIGAPLIDHATMPEAGREPIDPALFRDDDGGTWMYFGCRQPMVVKLDPSLTKLAGPLQPVVLLDPSGRPIPQALPDKQPALPMGYGEAPVVFKRGGKYYFVYSNGWAKESTLVYATGDSPAGPFTYAGPVMHRAASVTQHGSVVAFGGRWFLFYHTSDIPGGTTFRRAVCVDELTFDADGRIIPMMATATGPAPIGTNPARVPAPGGP
jgi:arabinoxylan arabinofuranohydrolase